MGCIISFLRSFRSYHGSHLTPKQLERQRQQRSKSAQNKPPREPSPPSSPEDDGERRPLSLDASSHTPYGAPPTQFTSFSSSSSPPVTTPTLGQMPRPKAPKFSFLAGGKGSKGGGKKSKGKR